MIKLLIIVLGLVIGVSVFGYFYGTLNKDQVLAPKLKDQVASSSGQPSPSQLDTYQTCTNASKKFSIKYPADWFTNKTGDACYYFGTTSLVDEKTALLTINSSYTPKDFTDLKASLARSDEERIILSTSNLEVGGFNTQKVETEATGTGASNKGSRSVYYLLDHPTLPVVFSYTEKTAQPDREKYVEILEVMVSSLTFEG